MWSVKIEPEKNSELIITGVYKRTRHPMYAAHLLWGIAQLLIFPNYIAGPSALLIFLIVIKIRIPREEEALIEQFGNEYKRYISQTGCIFPKLNY
jgi:protein-S-isoprenylcysteine O-methyltransferase Ste14